MNNLQKILLKKVFLLACVWSGMFFFNSAVFEQWHWLTKGIWDINHNFISSYATALVFILIFFLEYKSVWTDIK